ncbi:MAG TPA: F0F1 ATP synthase subunit B, partial [Acidimicrobiaceae bacterium]|nr:F0F1 ATP synthase subunit B [Acidimicrobiaceae bacterium]
MNSIGLLAAGDAGGGASNPILPVWNEIIWGGAAFAILFIAMAKFAYPAI